MVRCVLFLEAVGTCTPAADEPWHSDCEGEMMKVSEGFGGPAMKRAVMSAASAVPVLILVILVAMGLGACSRQESPAPAEGTATAADVAATAAAEDSPTEREAVRKALLDFTAEKRGKDAAADLRIVQIGTDSGYALTTWLRGDNGGQAVLKKEGGTWKVLSRDRGWYGIKGLLEVDVPEQVAKRLLDELDPNWVSYESKL